MRVITPIPDKLVDSIIQTTSIVMHIKQPCRGRSSMNFAKGSLILPTFKKYFENLV